MYRRRPTRIESRLVVLKLVYHQVGLDKVERIVVPLLNIVVLQFFLETTISMLVRVLNEGHGEVTIPRLVLNRLLLFVGERRVSWVG